MRRRSRSGLVFALGFGLAVGLGTGARAGDPARDLGDIEPAPSKDVDDANTAESQDLDQVLGDGPEDQHVVDSEAPDAEAESGEPQGTDGTSLDAADKSPEWTPPPCDEVELDLGNQPAAKETSAWRTLLEAARDAIEKTRVKLADADAEYTYARNRQSPRGAAFAQIIDARDKARVEYARARCDLPARVEAARRLGVPPEIWRDFPASID
jgi:hypothetical protein